jgi:hypothetical protein
MRKQYHFWPGEAGGDGWDAWDVERLIGLAAGLPVIEVELSTIAEIDSVYWFDQTHPPTVRNVVAHARLIAAADLGWPILLGHDGRVMDGMHRIARALLEGRHVLQARRFSEPVPPDFSNCQPDELPYD